MKHCARCGRDRPRDAFGPNRARPDGLQTWCRDCFNAYRRGRRDDRERYAVWVPEHIHRVTKAAAEDLDCSMGEIVTAALRAYLGHRYRGRRRPRREPVRELRWMEPL